MSVILEAYYKKLRENASKYYEKRIELTRLYKTFKTDIRNLSDLVPEETRLLCAERHRKLLEADKSAVSYAIYDVATVNSSPLSYRDVEEMWTAGHHDDSHYGNLLRQLIAHNSCRESLLEDLADYDGEKVDTDRCEILREGVSIELRNSIIDSVTDRLKKL